VVGWLVILAQAVRSAAYARFPQRRARDVYLASAATLGAAGARCAVHYSKLLAVILANLACPAYFKVVDLGTGWFVRKSGPCGCPRSHAGRMPEGLHGSGMGPPVPGEAGSGPLKSLPPASAEAYPA
jgi:hypothetical protein